MQQPAYAGKLPAFSRLFLLQQACVDGNLVPAGKTEDVRGVAQRNKGLSLGKMGEVSILTGCPSMRQKGRL